MRSIDFMIVLILGGLVGMSVLWHEKEKDVAQKVLPEPRKDKFLADVVPENMSVSMKKERFYYLVVPAVQKVHKEWIERYDRIAEDLNSTLYAQERELLKEKYNAQSDEELLASLKPHPPSITIAQAAMESAWATSRFFVEANNIFGVWSVGTSKPRIAASEQRDNNQTIWLRKFESVDEAVEEYYDMMARAPAYKDFRLMRLYVNDAFEIVKFLDKYSEIGEAYTQELADLIRYNKLTKFDKVLPLRNYP
ncbi:MAG: glucosaminidase domain-containing protein [Sulfurimonas sp.]|nr:glucosaminidase domain-containing protein [Sulfurimonas sp.]